VTRGDRTSDYDFELPSALIAQSPLDRRDASRLMVVRRDTGTIEHRAFTDLGDIVPAGDVIAVNRSKVIRARLLGARRGSGAPAEVLLLRRLADGRYEAMVSPGGKLKPGRIVDVAPELAIEILETTTRRTRIVSLRTTLSADAAIERFGHVPLPPYIARADVPSDADRYQTVFAREPGSVAAPTAGLHFTPDLLSALDRKGVRRAEVVLHVGPGTFKPVEVEDPSDHVMHEEWFDVPTHAAETINAARSAGRCVWAVGTTTVRTLESAAQADGTVTPGAGDTRIFLRPGSAFRVVDRLVTNFHLPRSTLMMLVAAFAGYDLTMTAYRTAVDAGYRFYSYGDAMVVI
jgi:S-adenosylmethionine:tRNA ribosyltransferase-isomerase